MGVHVAEKRPKIHYAFVVFAGCCCACAGSYGAIVSTVAVYVPAVCADLGVGTGDLLVWMTFFSVTSCISLPIWGKFLHTRNINIVTTVAALVFLIALAMFAFGNSVHWYWVWGAVVGCSLTCIGALLPPALINNWFDRSVAGKYVGIASAFSGLGAFVFAPAFTQLIALCGWRMTYVINVVVAAVLILPFTLFVFKYKPADKGMLPYGAPDVPADAGATASGSSAGMTKAEALRSPSFYLLAFAVVCITLVYGFNSNMVSMAGEFAGPVMGVEAATVLGAWMVSAASLGNVIGKVAFGFINDRIGIKPTYIIFVVVAFVGFLIWAVAPVAEVGMIVAAFAYGCHAALVNVGTPVLTRSLFGDKEYAPIYSTIISVNALLGGVSATLIGYIYQILGSYQAAVFAGLALLMLFLIAILMVFRRIDVVGSSEAAS